nr:hypothetical protein GCM10010200_018750 [Actinomadura rugatobispora]
MGQAPCQGGDGGGPGDEVAGGEGDGAAECPGGQKAGVAQARDRQSEDGQGEGGLDGDGRSGEGAGQERGTERGPVSDDEDGADEECDREGVGVPAADHPEQHHGVERPQERGAGAGGAVGAREPVEHVRGGRERGRVEELEPEDDPGHGGAAEVSGERVDGGGGGAVDGGVPGPGLGTQQPDRVSKPVQVLRGHGVRVVPQVGDAAVDGVVEDVDRSRDRKHRHERRGRRAESEDDARGQPFPPPPQGPQDGEGAGGGATDGGPAEPGDRCAGEAERAGEERAFGTPFGDQSRGSGGHPGAQQDHAGSHQRQSCQREGRTGPARP